MIKEDKIKINERIFLKPLENLPTRGRRNAPITGIKMLLKINPL